MTQLNSTAHSSTGDVDTNNASEPDPPIGGRDQLMEEHPQPHSVHPSANPSLDPLCHGQGQIDSHLEGNCPVTEHDGTLPAATPSPQSGTRTEQELSRQTQADAKKRHTPDQDVTQSEGSRSTRSDGRLWKRVKPPKRFL